MTDPFVPNHRDRSYLWFQKLINRIIIIIKSNQNCSMNFYLIDWSCCICRSSSEMVAEKVAWGLLIGVVGADFFFWRECNSSTVWAFTGGTLSSWQISSSFFLAVWIFGKPFRPFATLLVAKLNSPFGASAIAASSSAPKKNTHTQWL